MFLQGGGHPSKGRDEHQQRVVVRREWFRARSARNYGTMQESWRRVHSFARSASSSLRTSLCSEDVKPLAAGRGPSGKRSIQREIRVPVMLRLSLSQAKQKQVT